MLFNPAGVLNEILKIVKVNNIFLNVKNLKNWLKLWQIYVTPISPNN